MDGHDVLFAAELLCAQFVFHKLFGNAHREIIHHVRRFVQIVVKRQKQAALRGVLDLPRLAQSASPERTHDDIGHVHAHTENLRQFLRLVRIYKFHIQRDARLFADHFGNRIVLLIFRVQKG